MFHTNVILLKNAMQNINYSRFQTINDTSDEKSLKSSICVHDYIMKSTIIILHLLFVIVEPTMKFLYPKRNSIIFITNL